MRFLGAALDLTDRKQMEQALRQSQTELQLIINAMPVLIGYVDHEERFRLNNSAYLDWYGLTPQELYGRTIREVVGTISTPPAPTRSPPPWPANPAASKPTHRIVTGARGMR